MTEAVTSELIEAGHGADGSLYELWKSGALVDLLEIPHGVRDEIIGGKFVVSPAPIIKHGRPLRDISRAFVETSIQDPGFAWECLENHNLIQVSAGGGYIPDLVVLPTDLYDAAEEADEFGFTPDEVEMLVEVTSPGGAEMDRPPTARHRRTGKKGRSKWTNYATFEIPYYLLVDRSPKSAKTTLYSIPHRGTGAYLHQESWEFGETIQLPEPFGVEIETKRWKPWKR